MKSKCKWRCDGMVLDNDCKRVVRRWFCDIDQYDKEIGCNPSCHGYSRAKDKEEKK